MSAPDPNFRTSFLIGGIRERLVQRHEPDSKVNGLTTKMVILGRKVRENRVALIDAVKKQQTRIDAQQETIEQLRGENERLKSALCAEVTDAPICRTR